MKKIAVVILNWNGKKLLEQFLPSVIEYTNKDIADIIIADNASSDGSVRFLREQYPFLQIIELSENYGFAGGYNKALSQVDSEYYVLLNSDVAVTPDWLEPLTNFLDNNKHVAAVQPKILSQHNKEYLEYAGACGGFLDKYGYPFCRGRIFTTLEKDKGQYDNSIQIFWATGACMLIRSKDYREAGGLDGSFFAHMEEIDLCWRLNARGKEIYCIPQSAVYHVGGATLTGESPRKTFLNFRNNILMLYKNMEYTEFRKVYYIRIVLDYLAALQMFLTGKAKNAQAVVNAHKEFKLIRKKYSSTRKENLEKRTVKEIGTIYSKSILWQYYVKNMKTFGRLYRQKISSTDKMVR